VAGKAGERDVALIAGCGGGGYGQDVVAQPASGEMLDKNIRWLRPGQGEAAAVDQCPHTEVTVEVGRHGLQRLRWAGGVGAGGCARSKDLSDDASPGHPGDHKAGTCEV